MTAARTVTRERKIPHYQRVVFAERVLRAVEPGSTGACASAPEAAALARRLIGASAHEEIVVVGLDARNRVIATATVAVGGAHMASVTVADVLRVVLLTGARAFVLAHNHPGGDPTPSREDVEMTERLQVAAACVGLPLVDHVVVTPGGEWRSMLEKGLIR